MNKFYYSMQVFAITICSTCALMVAVYMLCGCSSKANNTATVDARLYNVTTPDTISDVVNDTDAKQLKVCESLLNECAKCGILDAKGIQAFNELKTKKSVSAYIELITECECEENFYDTVGSGDTWCCYVWYVLEPRGLAE